MRLPRGKPWRRVRLWVELALLTVIGFGGCGSGNRLFYWPNRLVYSDPAREGTEVEDVTFEAPDGTSLHAWFVPARPGEARGTVVYFHGNAQNLTAHYAFVSWLPAEGYNLFLFDYRGFGRSEGHPTREGTFRDSVAALAAVRSRPDVDPDRLVGFGQSLGGALLLAALGETDPSQVRGVAIESSFASYRNVAQAKLAESPLTWLFQWPLSRWLVTGEHSPADSLDRLEGVPLLILHGDADEIVPFSQGQELFRLAPEPKRFIRVPGGRHVEATGGSRFGATYRNELRDFFDRCLSRSAAD